MTVYHYLTPFIFNEQDSECFCSCVDMKSEYVVRVDVCIRLCYWYFMGCGKWDKYYDFSRKKWMDISENGDVTITDFCPQGYENMLDNFNSYYGVVEDDNTLTIISLGSSLTHNPIKHGFYNQETMSEGFGIVIDKLTNKFVLVTLGEDDGNYWASHEISYKNLSKYDRNEVIRIVNDVNENHFFNKQDLIKKLWYE